MTSNKHLKKELYEVAKIYNDRVEEGEKKYKVRWQFTDEYA